MSSSDKDKPATTVIDLADLPMEQLQAVRQQIEEVNFTNLIKK